MSDFFTVADVISSYSRAQAIEDGVLVELPAELCREAGFKFHVATTRAAFDLCCDLTPAAKRACNDVTGRMWDVLWMLKQAIRRASNGSLVSFSLHCVTKSVRPSVVHLKAICGPADDGSPCITIMLPNED